MGQASSVDNPELARNSAQAIEQLSAVFAAYNDTTDQLERSYTQLQSEVGRLRVELQHKSELLERKSRLAALGEMAAGLAHEIRNPLGGVQLYASLLERDLQERPEQLQWAQKIGKGVRNLDTIVTDVLAFAQDQLCQKVDVNVRRLLEEVMDMALGGVANSGVDIDLRGVDAELNIEADPNMMQRVLANLILNAIEATEGQGKVSVEAESCTADQNYKSRICIADTGPGIKRDLMSKIFNPFFTSKDSGTGLGLAIVHRLVECHGGIITAANQEPHGAVFTILLP